MKVNWLIAATVAIAAGLGLTLPASAQNPTQNVSGSDYYVGEGVVTPVSTSQPSSSDQPGAPPAVPCQAPACAPACEEAEEEECPCEPWHLFCQKECGTNVYGYVNAGIMWNADSPVDNFNGPTTFPDRDYGQFNGF